MVLVSTATAAAFWTGTGTGTGTGFASTTSETYFDSALEDVRIAVYVRRYVAEVTWPDEVLGGRDWNGLCSVPGGVQPVTHVLDLRR